MTVWLAAALFAVAALIIAAAISTWMYLVAIRTSDPGITIGSRVLREAEADFRSQDPSVPLKTEQRRLEAESSAMLRFDDGFDMTRDGSGDA